MITPVVRRKTSPKGADVRWLSFDSLRDYYTWLSDESTRLSKHNGKVFSTYNDPQKLDYYSREQLVQWYGKADITFEQLETHSEYQNPDLADKVGASFRAKLQPLLNRFEESNVNLRKMRYNALGLGVFSFDRASIGLMRMRTGDTQPIDLHNRRMEIELGYAKDANDLTRSVTTVKDVFAWFPSAPAASRTIKLYLEAGATSKYSAKEMLYTGIGIAEVSDFLVSNGYAVEVRLLIGSAHPGGVKSLVDVAAKRYKDSLDKNLLLTLSSDPMFFRHNGFKGIIAIANATNISIEYNLGRELGIADAMATIAPADTTSIYFRNTYSEAETIAEVERIISLVTSKNTTTP